MSYWYLATPYTLYRDGLECAYQLACRSAAHLIRQGVHVYSPIAHSHGIAHYGDIDPRDGRFWLKTCEPFMRASYGLLVLHVDGTSQSLGVAHERAWFERAHKPVRQILPAHLETPNVVALLKEHLDLASGAVMASPGMEARA